MPIEVMFYQANPNRDHSICEFYTLDQNANFQLLKRYETFWKAWSEIIHIDSVFDAFTLEPRGDLLFYERNQGWCDFVSVDKSGIINNMRRNNVRKTWTHIIPVYFENHTNIFFYNGNTGDCEVYRYICSRQPDCNDSNSNRGSGNLSQVSLFNIGKNWTQIVSGIFGGEYGGLLFYDKDGNAKFYRMDRRGTLVNLSTYSFSKTWKKIIPIPFGFRTDLFFYDATNDLAEIYYISDQGAIILLNRINTMGKTWSNIIPIETGRDFAQPYVFFYDPVGMGELYRIDARGNLLFLNHKDTYNRDWTHILPLRVQMAPRIYRIRIHAIVAGPNPSPSGPGSTFTAGISSSDIKPMVETVNSYFKETGIQFEFDLTTDLEEIESVLINQDQPLDNSGKPLSQSVPQLPDGRPLHEQGEARIQLGERYQGKLVIIFRDFSGNTCFGPSYSGNTLPFVIMDKTRGVGGRMTHEIGHYLLLQHTFGYQPTTIQDAQLLITNEVESKDAAKAAIQANKPIPKEIIEQGLNVFDGDIGFGVTDTPPDPSDTLFGAALKSGLIKNGNLDPVPISVTFHNGQTHQYIIDPDRFNIMSYFDNPGNSRRFTPSQTDIIRDALENGKRKHLVRHAYYPPTL
jgi:hypothetical protein